jgi:hypothetical protein
MIRCKWTRRCINDYNDRDNDVRIKRGCVAEDRDIDRVRSLLSP